MFESNYNYVPNPYPPAPGPAPVPPAPQQGYYPYPPHPPVPGPVVPPVIIDHTLSIPGAAADAAVTGKLISAKVDLSSLVGNIQLIDGKLELVGLAEASTGQVPSKNEDGTLLWIPVATPNDISNLQSQIDSVNGSIETINSQIETISADVLNNSTILNSLVNEENGRVVLLESKVEELENTIGDISSQFETKLDKETFNRFLNETFAQVAQDVEGLKTAVEELQNCCGQVQNVLNFVLGDGALTNPEMYYTQPLYQTLQDFETHTQSVNRDFDGGDLDDDVQTISVPNVVGMLAPVANLVLGKLGLFTEASYDGESFEDVIVLAQSPLSGSAVAVGSVIELQVGSGEEIGG